MRLQVLCFFTVQVALFLVMRKHRFQFLYLLLRLSCFIFVVLGNRLMFFHELVFEISLGCFICIWTRRVLRIGPSIRMISRPGDWCQENQYAKQGASLSRYHCFTGNRNIKWSLLLLAKKTV